VRWRPEAVISGAQTGVDRGALEAAISAGFKIGGWVPAGRRAEDGQVPLRYPMWEMPDRGYAARTRANVVEADATLILTRGVVNGGTYFTVAECERLEKPHLVVDLGQGETVAWNIQQWLDIYTPRILNVAGPRESKARGIQAEAQALLERVFLESGSPSSTTNQPSSGR
jgi:hypothetical protein